MRGDFFSGSRQELAGGHQHPLLLQGAVLAQGGVVVKGGEGNSKKSMLG